MPYLYILRSEISGRYYIGSTGDLDRRISEHRRGQTTSTRYESQWTCAFAQETRTLQEARKLERKIKGWKSKTLIDKVIQDQRLEGF